nr:MAG TPA: hypothetical protein [Caudoviricetes sp.]
MKRKLETVAERRNMGDVPGRSCEGLLMPMRIGQKVTLN